MKLGFHSRPKHISFNRCLRVVSVSLPWFGSHDLFSWDASEKEALCHQDIVVRGTPIVGSTLNDYLEQLPSQWD
jgi:hypothetical protein